MIFKDGILTIPTLAELFHRKPQDLTYDHAAQLAALNKAALDAAAKPTTSLFPPQLRTQPQPAPQEITNESSSSQLGAGGPDNGMRPLAINSVSPDSGSGQPVRFGHLSGAGDSPRIRDDGGIQSGSVDSQSEVHSQSDDPRPERGGFAVRSLSFSGGSGNGNDGNSSVHANGAQQGLSGSIQLRSSFGGEVMGIVNIIALLLPVLTTVLQNQGVIGSSTSNLITSLLSTITPLISNLQNGTSKVQDTLAVLGALTGVIASLKANTSLPAATLAEINQLDLDVQAALTAYVQSGKGVDLSVLTPIAPVARNTMAKGYEQEMTGEHDGGDMKIGGKKRKLISSDGKAKKRKAKKGKKKAHHKKHSAKK
ncbi:unnamed protein product [Sphagnum jensenii]